MKPRLFVRHILLLAIVVGMMIVPPAAINADTSAVINFQGFGHGDFTDTLTCAQGVNCAGSISGQIGVWGYNPWTEPFASGANAAQVFDTDASYPTETLDWDLINPFDGGLPNLNNIMFVSDMEGELPSDEYRGIVNLNFDFSAFGPGVVTVERLTIIDIDNNEAAGTIEVWGPGGYQSFAMPVTGNHRYQVMNLYAAGVDRMLVTFTSSGALTDIHITVPEPPDQFQGCTPGYWRQNQHFDSWVTYAPGDSFDTIVGVDVGGLTMRQAVRLGGGHDNALIRHTAAALLNATNPNVAYPYNPAQIIAMFQAAYGTANWEVIKDTFAYANEAGCPLN
ncbi:MAG: hypothetical protein JXB38_13025 [Anaerolineales bacterium]|nr:hypothetical protein [Anaerolineales bacterium]